MATTIGKEKNLVEMLNNLIELDFDAVEAYEAAISRIDDAVSKEHLRQFMGDHQRHTRELSVHVRELGGQPSTSGDFKRFLTKGKVVLADLAGDRAILMAMKSNEEDTNTAYERAAGRDDVPAQVGTVLALNLEDERRHRAWIENRIAELK